MARHVVGRDQLTGVARAALGARRHLVGVERLRGGSKKGVYRLALDDGSTAIAYIWDTAENYWPAAETDQAQGYANPFSHASGADLFEAAHRRLEALGVRTPRIHLVDRSGAHFPTDVAVVEDVPGETLEAVLHRESPGAAAVLARLADALDVMQRHRGADFGKVALIDDGGVSVGGSCEQVLLDRARDDLAEAASRDARLAAAHGRLEDTLDALAAAIAPRSEYGLIHGELGPDHVLIDRHGQPAIIDIEGLMFFDVEWEHAFLRLRFHEHYRSLHRAGLDGQRLSFYTLAMRLSLVAGPLRLLDGDFQDRDAMMGIAEHNLQQALAFVGS